MLKWEFTKSTTERMTVTAGTLKEAIIQSEMMAGFWKTEHQSIYINKQYDSELRGSEGISNPV